MLGGSDGTEEGGKGVAGDAIVVLLVGHLPSGPRHTGEPGQGCGEVRRQARSLGRGGLVSLGAGDPVPTRSHSDSRSGPSAPTSAAAGELSASQRRTELEVTATRRK